MAFILRARVLRPVSGLGLVVAGVAFGQQLETTTIVRSVANERRIAALIAIHDLFFATRFSDRLVMLGGGQVRVQGGWKDVPTTSHLEAVYGVSALVGTDQNLPYVIPTAAQINT